MEKIIENFFRKNVGKFLRKFCNNSKNILEKIWGHLRRILGKVSIKIRGKWKYLNELWEGYFINILRKSKKNLSKFLNYFEKILGRFVEFLENSEKIFKRNFESTKEKFYGDVWKIFGKIAEKS